MNWAERQDGSGDDAADAELDKKLETQLQIAAQVCHRLVLTMQGIWNTFSKELNKIEHIITKITLKAKKEHYKQSTLVIRYVKQTLI